MSISSHMIIVSALLTSCSQGWQDVAKTQRKAEYSERLIAEHAIAPWRTLAEVLLVASSATHSNLAGAGAQQRLAMGYTTRRGDRYRRSQSAIRLNEDSKGSVPLWLDLRGLPQAKDLDILTSLYNDVRKRLEEARSTLPKGAGVVGIVHDVTDLDVRSDANSTGLQLLALGKNGALLLNGTQVGQSVVTSVGTLLEYEEAGKVLHAPYDYLALFGGGEGVISLINFVLYFVFLWAKRGELWEDEAKNISTTVLAEISDVQSLMAVSRTSLLNDGHVPIALLMKPEPDLWFSALSRSFASDDSPPRDSDALSQEKVQLVDTLGYAEAVLERNARQLDSYVDEAHQWEDQTEEEQYYIGLKPMMEQKLDAVLRAERSLL